jgi:hypothetical protein
MRSRVSSVDGVGVTNGRPTIAISGVHLVEQRWQLQQRGTREMLDGSQWMIRQYQRLGIDERACRDWPDADPTFASHGPQHAVEPSLLREAFRWSVMSRVTSTASVSMAGNRYSVDEALIGRRIELRFDPEDLTRLEVYWDGHPAGQAIPFILGHHVHRRVPQAEPASPPAATGVDDLGLVLAHITPKR